VYYNDRLKNVSIVFLCITKNVLYNTQIISQPSRGVTPCGTCAFQKVASSRRWHGAAICWPLYCWLWGPARLSLPGRPRRHSVFQTNCEHTRGRQKREWVISRVVFLSRIFRVIAACFRQGFPGCSCLLIRVQRCKRGNNLFPIRVPQPYRHKTSSCDRQRQRLFGCTTRPKPVMAMLLVLGPQPSLYACRGWRPRCILWCVCVPMGVYCPIQPVARLAWRRYSHTGSIFPQRGSNAQAGSGLSETTDCGRFILKSGVLIFLRCAGTVSLLAYPPASIATAHSDPFRADKYPDAWTNVWNMDDPATYQATIRSVPWSTLSPWKLSKNILGIRIRPRRPAVYGWLFFVI
jgi:hypothetical protein